MSSSILNTSLPFPCNLSPEKNKCTCVSFNSMIFLALIAFSGGGGDTFIPLFFLSVIFLFQLKASNYNYSKHFSELVFSLVLKHYIEKQHLCRNIPSKFTKLGSTDRTSSLYVSLMQSGLLKSRTGSLSRKSVNFSSPDRFRNTSPLQIARIDFKSSIYQVYVI